MNLMPLGPTAYGLGMGGKSMSAGQKKWGDRAFGNTMEHFPLFNAALWLHAVYCSPVVATQLGAAYLVLVVMYPTIWALVGGESGVPTKPYSVKPPFGPLGQIYYSTFPRYGIVFYLALSAVLKIAFDICLNTIVKMPLVLATLGFGWFLYHVCRRTRGHRTIAFAPRTYSTFRTALDRNHSANGASTVPSISRFSASSQYAYVAYPLLHEHVFSKCFAKA